MHHRVERLQFESIHDRQHSIRVTNSPAGRRPTADMGIIPVKRPPTLRSVAEPGNSNQQPRPQSTTPLSAGVTAGRRPGPPRVIAAWTTSGVMVSSDLVRRLRRYYGTVRLPTPVHPRITASAFPARPAR